MPDISCQFWALPEEIAPFVKNFVIEFRLHIVGMKFFPFTAIEIEQERIENVILNHPEFERYAFTLYLPDIPDRSDQIEFSNMNPNRLTMDIGRITEKGLSESWLTTRAQDPEVFAIWKKVANQLRKMTTAGVTTINPNTGESGYERTFRYTVGAKQCEVAGIPILPVAGKLHMRLGKPTDF